MTENEKAIEQLERISKNLGSIGESEDWTEIAIQALEEVQQYREICTPEVLALATKLSNIAKNCGTIGKVIDEWVDFKEIGTVEECRKAVDVRKRVQEIADGQLIAGKNNYGEVYDCFRKTVKVGTRKLLDWCEKLKEDD